jgi:hypothetical protein
MLHSRLRQPSSFNHCKCMDERVQFTKFFIINISPFCYYDLCLTSIYSSEHPALKHPQSMTPCSPLSFNRRFGGTYHLHLQGRRNKFSKIQKASRWKAENDTLRNHRCENFKSILLVTCLLAGFCLTYFFDPEDGGDMFLRNVGWNSTD